MKDQYLVGVSTKDFIRMTNGDCLVGCSLTLEEAKVQKVFVKKSKIYKLVEVKK